MTSNNDYLLFDKDDPTKKRNYAQYRRNRHQDYGIWFCLGLVVAIPVTCGLFSISSSLDRANIPALENTVNQITKDFDYIKSINENLKELSTSIEEIQSKYTSENIYELLIKMNIALDELINLLEIFPPHNYNTTKQTSQTTQINQIKQIKQIK